MKQIDLKSTECQSCRLAGQGEIKDGKCELCRNKVEPEGFWQKVRRMWR